MRDILFMGTILASVTHEMQNVMAIIKESGALTEDILSLNGPPRMKHGDKLPSALTNIKEQVERGRNLMLMLNGFAHAAADFAEGCDLPRFARQIVTLAERMAKLRECHLVLAPYEGTLPVQGNALLIMQSMYFGIQDVLLSCEKGDTVTMTLHKTHDAGTVTFSVANRSTIFTAGEELAGLVQALSGTCTSSSGALVLGYPLLPTSSEVRV